MVLSVVALTTYTLSTANAPNSASQLLAYFICEQDGYQESDPCNRESFRQLAHPELITIVYVSLGIFPVVNLIYVVNIRELREKCRVCSLVKNATNADAILMKSTVNENTTGYRKEAAEMKKI